MNWAVFFEVVIALWLAAACYFFGRLHQRDIDDHAIARAGELLELDDADRDYLRRLYVVSRAALYDQDEEPGR